MSTYTPQQVVAIGLANAERAEAQRHRAIPFPIPGIDDYIAHLLPGEIFSILAQTHMNKSGLIEWWEYKLATSLLDNGRTDEVIVHVDTETVIEDQAAAAFGRQAGVNPADIVRGNIDDWDALRSAAVQVGVIPIVRIGVSLGAQGDSFSDIYLSHIEAEMTRIESGQIFGNKRKVAALFVDYLQALPFDPEVKRASLGDRRRLQVRADMFNLRDIGRRFSTPVIVGVQAKQDLSGHLGPNMYIPGIYDGVETADIATRTDRMVSLWMPKNTHSQGEALRHKDLTFTVRENLMFVRALKQRGRLPSGRVWPCYIDFATGRILVAQRLE